MTAAAMHLANDLTSDDEALIAESIKAASEAGYELRHIGGFSFVVRRYEWHRDIEGLTQLRHFLRLSGALA